MGAPCACRASNGQGQHALSDCASLSLYCGVSTHVLSWLVASTCGAKYLATLCLSIFVAALLPSFHVPRAASLDTSLLMPRLA